jgi:putative Holliday junction resolvase
VPVRPGVRLALDWGDARIGVARSDPAGVLAFPYAAVRAGAGEQAALVALVREAAPLEVIVGLPRSLSGGEGPAAAKNRTRAAALAGALAGLQPPVPVRLVDERLTTVTASRRLREGGRKAREQRQVIDAAAAVTILEHALAVEAARDLAPGELVSAPDASGRAAAGAGDDDRQPGEM